MTATVHELGSAHPEGEFIAATREHELTVWKFRAT